mmetsp:Transcript_27005/g.53168  ORF Transcript_27005/g.53168 Transcript_27005/m.53168 type:complete len:184 (+) Transcript_27005:101-652(+)
MAHDNHAFVFIKPHAVNKRCQNLVEDELKKNGIQIVAQGSISSNEIETNKLIDKHYYAIASKATLLDPKDLVVPEDKFKDAFGVGFKEAVADGHALNALQACEYFGVDGGQLEVEWRKNPAVKFGGGFYCAKVDSIAGKDAKYVFNAFFLRMRESFVQKGNCPEREFDLLLSGELGLQSSALE